MTVKKRIFISNACMILVTIFLVFIINLGVVKIYLHSIEQDWQNSMESHYETTSMEDLLEDWTLHQQSFYIILAGDVVVCGAVWIFVSFLFTGQLAKQILYPLQILRQGAKRIKENDLTHEIVYEGDQEFEEICQSFNEMQTHLLLEQNKNAKYEKARTEMVAGISHDLRTPLTAIQGNIKGILDGIISQEQQNIFLKTAYKRSEEMNVLLNQLFYISKLETGNMPLSLQQVDLKEWIESYVQKVKDVEIITEFNIENPMVAIDIDQFGRIFDNLLENSKKYASVDPLRIYISLNETESMIQICFSDNGKGVENTQLSHIFDEFYRVDTSRNEKEGSGLGLYIVKSLIEAMHGSVWAKNTPGLSIYMQLAKGDENHGNA